MRRQLAALMPVVGAFASLCVACASFDSDAGPGNAGDAATAAAPGADAAAGSDSESGSDSAAGTDAGGAADADGSTPTRGDGSAPFGCAASWTFCDDFNAAVEVETLVAAWGGADDASRLSLIPDGVAGTRALRVGPGTGFSRLRHKLALPSRVHVRLDLRPQTPASSQFLAIDYVTSTGAYSDAIVLAFNDAGELVVRRSDPPTPVALGLRPTPGTWQTVEVDVGPQAIRVVLDGVEKKDLGFRPAAVVAGLHVFVGAEGAATLDLDNVGIRAD